MVVVPVPDCFLNVPAFTNPAAPPPVFRVSALSLVAVKTEPRALVSIEPLSIRMLPPDHVLLVPPRVSEPPLRYCVVVALVIEPPPSATSVLDGANVPPDHVNCPETLIVAFPPKLPL